MEAPEEDLLDLLAAFDSLPENSDAERDGQRSSSASQATERGDTSHEERCAGDRGEASGADGEEREHREQREEGGREHRETGAERSSASRSTSRAELVTSRLPAGHAPAMLPSGPLEERERPQSGAGETAPSALSDRTLWNDATASAHPNARGGGDLAERRGETLFRGAAERGQWETRRTGATLTQCFDREGEQRNRTEGGERVNDPFALDDGLAEFFDATLPATRVERWADFLAQRSERQREAACVAQSPLAARQTPGSPSVSLASARSNFTLSRGPPISPPLRNTRAASTSNRVASALASSLSSPIPASSAGCAASAPCSLEFSRREEGDPGEEVTQSRERNRDIHPSGAVAATAPLPGVYRHPPGETGLATTRLRHRPLSLADYFSRGQQPRRRCLGASADAEGSTEGREESTPASSLSCSRNPLSSSSLPSLSSSLSSSLSGSSLASPSLSSSSLPSISSLSSPSAASSSYGTEGAQGTRGRPGSLNQHRIYSPVSAFPPPISPPSPLRPPSSCSSSSSSSSASSSSSSPSSSAPSSSSSSSPSSSAPSSSAPSSSPSSSSSSASVSAAASEEGSSRRPPSRVPPPPGAGGGAAPPKKRQTALRWAPLPGPRQLGGASFFFGQEQECPVCLAEFGAVAELASVDDCRHAFCLACISKWVRQSRSCPLCRGPTTTVSLWKARAHAKPDEREKVEGSEGKEEPLALRAFAYARRLQPDRNNVLKPVPLGTKSSRNSNHTRGVRRMQPRRAKASPVTRPTARPLRPASSSASDLREEIQLDAQNRQPDVADTHEIEVLESVETTQA
ncbi:zinc finger, C3HC4 type (RING finger) domain-containing protein [Toxoplasma gondii CAST]|uniref:Zinc finger, C3HC4 type (RING finger) domain-containing protein n=1 Tax=Toxoplasma gondii CAST TaxID=943122 RepID=A0A3R8A853_TOXGO|nr:zinc finger, C3HC4 type (RING finger) domain-containing protein [Toxoplasma gondii CAST]